MLADAGFEVTILHCDSREDPIPYPLSPKVSRINLWAKAARQAPWYLALDVAARGYPKLGALAPVQWLSSNLYFLRRLYAVARNLRPDVMISFLPPANTPTLLAGWMAGTKVLRPTNCVPVHDYRSAVRWDQNPIDKLLRFWSLRQADRIHRPVPGLCRVVSGRAARQSRSDPERGLAVVSRSGAGDDAAETDRGCGPTEPREELRHADRRLGALGGQIPRLVAGDLRLRAEACGAARAHPRASAWRSRSA